MMKRFVLMFAALGLLFACTPEENKTGDNNGNDGIVHVTGISLDRPTATIKEGESITLVATVTPANADNKNVTWTTSSEAVATVDNNGKVTGVKAGSATITATTEDGGKKETCALSIEANLAPSVTVEANHVSAISAVLAGKANLGSTVASDLKVGFQYSKSAGILPSNSTTIEATDADANYNYTTSITGLEPATKYYFRSFVRQNGQDTYGETKEFKTKDISSLIHTQDASAVSAVSSRLNASLDLTDVQYQNEAHGFYWGASAESVSNKVSSTESDGVLSAFLSSLTPSTQYFYQAYITLDGKELKEEVISFTTKDLDTMLETNDASEIEATRATLHAKLDLTDVKYSSITYGFYWGTSEASQNNSRTGGSISENAYTASLTDLSPKTQYWYNAYVKLDSQTFYGDVKTFTTDIVPVQSVSLDKTEYTFHTIGNTLTLNATVLPSDATDKSVEWSSDKEDVATVDHNGKVTAKAYGKAIITVTTKDQGKTASCEVTVAQLVTSILLSKTSLSLMIGEEETISVTSVLPDNANDKTYTWSSSDNAIASVDQNGKIIAKAKGKTVIKATANDGSGVTASCEVTVSSVCPDGAVDLGLTTSEGYRLYWATCNLSESGFVSSPEEYGDYYAWGETAPYYSSQAPLKWKSGKTGYNWASYSLCNGSSSTLTKYNNLSSYGTFDNKTVLETGPNGDDVASKNLGGSWRMPTDEEWTALRTNCTWTWTTNYNGTGVAGRIVTSNVEGYKDKSIFLPAAGARNDSNLLNAGSYGLYWSSSLNTGYPFRAWGVLFYSFDVGSSDLNRYYGQSVRPVSE